MCSAEDPLMIAKLLFREMLIFSRTPATASSRWELAYADLRSGHVLQVDGIL